LQSEDIQDLGFKKVIVPALKGFDTEEYVLVDIVDYDQMPIKDRERLFREI